MANENEKNPSALEELRRLKRTDRIKSLDIHEPELHDFTLSLNQKKIYAFSVC